MCLPNNAVKRSFYINACKIRQSDYKHCYSVLQKRDFTWA